MSDPTRPEVWRRLLPPASVMASCLFFTGVAVLFGSSGVWQATHDEVRSGVALFLCTVALGAFVPFILAGRLPRWRAGVEEVRFDAGLLFPYARWFAVSGVAWIFAMAALFTLIVASGDVDSPREVIAVGAVLALTGWLLVGVASRRFTRGKVVLSSAGIRHWSWAFTVFAPWDAVIGVHPVDAYGPMIVVLIDGDSVIIERRTRLWPQPELTFLPDLAIRAGYLTTSPMLLLRALEHYAAYPEDRPELATEAALLRLGSLARSR